MKKMLRRLTFAALLLCGVTNAQNGTNDPTFNPDDTQLNNGVDSAVNEIELQPDGKILVGGVFHRYKNTESHYLVRLNADKSYDTGFNIDTLLDGSVSKITVMPNGKIMVYGNFTHFGDTVVSSLLRLNADGTLDTTFVTGTGFNYGMVDMFALPDGKLLVAGNSSAYNGTPCNMAVLLNEDGTIDPSYNFTGTEGMQVVSLQEDGKLLVSGYSNGTYLKRFNSNGTLDTGFSALPFDTFIRSIVTQPDGKVIVGGDFSNYGNQSIQGVVRLNENGTIDTSFTNADLNGGVVSVLLQPDGKIALFGYFTSYDDNAANNAVRLNADGTFDNTFSTPQIELDNFILTAKYTNGQILIGGMFTKYGNYCMNYFGGLNNDGTLNQEGYGIDTGANNTVNYILNAGNGNMLISGSFTHYNGVPANGIALINADGALLPNFSTGTGPNGVLKTILKQTDGKYILFGDFTSYNGTECKSIIRINADGTLDNTFDAALPQYVLVNNVKIDANDKILVFGANSETLNGSYVNRLAFKLNTDGSMDTTFNCVFSATGNNLYGDAQANYAEILSNGKIIFSLGNGAGYPKLLKVNTDGSIDNTFTVLENTDLFYNAWEFIADGNGKFYIRIASFDESATSYETKRIDENGVFDTDFSFISSQAILAAMPGGKFFAYNSGNLEQYNYDGTLDETFSDGEGFYRSGSFAFYPQQDKVIMAGNFTRYDGVFRNRILRVHNEGVLGNNVISPTVQSVIAYNDRGSINVTSQLEPLSSVQVYDLTGRLLAHKDNISAKNVALDGIASKGVFIIKATLTNGIVISKKIM